MICKKMTALGASFLLLSLAVAAGSAQQISYSFKQGEGFTTILEIKTSDGNIGVDANTVEVTLNERMRTKQDFTQTRVGEYSATIPNAEMLDANTMTIVADGNQLTVDLNVVKDNNITATVSTMMLQENTTQQGLSWLQQNAWQGQIADNYIEVPNFAIVGGIIALIALAAWKQSKK